MYSRYAWSLFSRIMYHGQRHVDQKNNNTKTKKKHTKKLLIHIISADALYKLCKLCCVVLKWVCAMAMQQAIIVLATVSG